MYAVGVNPQSLDLIATNNGGIRPEIEGTPGARPWTYFVLPSDPNDPAVIISADEFFTNYEFVEPELRDKFVKIKQKVEPYTISRDLLARMVAAHTSGRFNAIPEQADYDHADGMIAFLEEAIA